MCNPLHLRDHSHGHSHLHPAHASRREFLSSLVSAFVLLPWAYREDKNPADVAERFRKMSEEYEREGLAQPFKGVTTNGDIAPGLFEISPTGVATDAARNAAEKFIGSLIAVQLARTMFPVDDVQWRKWMNQHFYVRQGISFQEMTDAQRDLAFGLMHASLSARGFEVTRTYLSASGSISSRLWGGPPPPSSGAGSSAAITLS